MDVLPTGLISRLQESSEEFATALGVEVPEAAAAPLLDLFERHHEATMGGFEAAAAHLRHELERTRNRLTDELNNANHQLELAQGELSSSRRTADKQESRLSTRLVKALQNSDILETSLQESKTAAAKAEERAVQAERAAERASSTLQARPASTTSSCTSAS